MSYITTSSVRIAVDDTGPFFVVPCNDPAAQPEESCKSTMYMNFDGTEHVVTGALIQNEIDCADIGGTL